MGVFPARNLRQVSRGITQEVLLPLRGVVGIGGAKVHDGSHVPSNRHERGVISIVRFDYDCGVTVTSGGYVDPVWVIPNTQLHDGRGQLLAKLGIVLDLVECIVTNQDGRVEAH
jgi:hypothetical protein